MTTHIDSQTLVAYAAGMIVDEDALEPIEEHLLICEECRVVVTHADRQLRLSEGESERLLSRPSGYSRPIKARR